MPIMTHKMAEYLNKMNIEGGVRVPENDRDAMAEAGWIRVNDESRCFITGDGERALECAGEYVVVMDDTVNVRGIVEAMLSSSLLSKES